MHFPVSTVLTLLLVGLVSATPKDRTATLYQWPLTSQTPTPLAEITYNPATLTGSYRPVTAELIASDEPTRIGVLAGKSERWVGTAVMLSNEGNPSVSLSLDKDGDIWHVEFTNDPMATEAQVKVENVAGSTGAKPVLNRPVVLNPDGKLPVPEVEKTFIQKYWWVLLGGMVLLVGSGGGE